MSLARKTLLGIAWTLLSNGSARVITLAGTLLLVRWIDPVEYGEVLGAAVISATAMAMSSLGMGQYVIARPRAGRDHVFHVTAFSFIACTLLCGGALLLGRTIGAHFNVTHVMRYLPLLAVAALLDRMASVPERVLVRDMRFRAVGLTNASGELAYTAISLTAVLLGVDGMAVVYGNLARPLLRLCVYLFVCDRREWLTPSPLSWTTTRTIFEFGLPLSVGNLADFAARRWDGLLVSRYFGPATLAMYNLSYHLADVPSSQLGEQVGDVLLPSFAHLAPAERKVAFARSMRLLGLLVFPLAIGLGATAPTVVKLFFATQWSGIGPMLVVMCVFSFARPITFVMMSYLQAANRPGTLSLLELLKLAVLLGTLFTVGRLSPILACTAVGIAFFAQLVVGLYALRRLDDVPLLPALLGLVPPLFACLPMAATVLAVRFAAGSFHWYRGVAGLALEVGCGGAVYVAGAFLFARSTTRDLINLARNFLRRRSAESQLAPRAAAE